MSIAYIWFNKYGNLNNVEINFSKEFVFKFDDGKLTKNKRTYNNDFLEMLGYKNIDNPIAIIGENGAGKSTIIRFLMDLQFYEGTFPDYYNYIIIFYKGGRYTAFSNFSVDFNVESNFSYVPNNDALFNRKIGREFETNNIINYTEAFNPYRYNELIALNRSTDFDYSVEGRIARYRKKYLNNKFNIDPIQFYQYKLVENQIRVIDEFSKITGFSNTISVEIIRFEKEKSDVLEIIDTLYTVITERYAKGKNSILYALAHNLVNRMLLSMNVISRKKEKAEEIILIVDRMVKKIELFQPNITLEEIVSILEITEEFPKNQVLIINEDEKKNYITVLRYLYNTSGKMTYLSDIDRFLYDPETYNGWNEFVEFYEAYAKTTCNGTCAYLNFSWGMSTGEMSLLNMYATIKEIVEKIKNGKANNSTDIILFFDEAGLYWHPRWQQEGMKRILDILSKVDNQVQLILATHSPIFLSDFPKSNVYWLSAHDSNKIDERLETFGANIYNLYRDSFFLNQGFGTVVGILSVNVIEKISARLLEMDKLDIKGEDGTQFQKELNIIKNDIEQIGEYIFRKDLLCKWEKVYKKLFGENEYTEERYISIFTKFDKSVQKRILNRIRSEEDG